MGQTPFYLSVDAFPNDQEIFAISQDANGRMIISTSQGVFRFNGYKSSEIPVAGVKGDPIIEFVLYHERLIGLTKTGNLLTYTGESWQLLQIAGLKASLQHIELYDDHMLANSKTEIFEIDLENNKIQVNREIPFTDKQVKANAVTTYKGVAYALLNTGEIVDIQNESAWSLPNNKGRQLIGFDKELFILPEQMKYETVYRFNGSDFRILGSLSSKESGYIGKGELLDGKLYVTSSSGVYVYRYPKAPKAEFWNFSTKVNDVYLDEVGNTWLATSSKGLLLIPAGKHQLLFNQPVASISGGEAIYFTDLYGKIYSIQHGAVQSKGQLASNEGNWLHADAQGGYYFTEHGVHTFDDDHIYVTENLKHVFQLKNGSWIQATGAGIQWWPSMSLERWMKPKKREKVRTLLSNVSILQAATNKKRDEFLVATDAGLYWFNDSLKKLEITHYKKKLNAIQITFLESSWFVLTSDNMLHEIKNGRVLRSRHLGGKGNAVICKKLLAVGDWLYYLTDKGVYRTKGINEPIHSLASVMGFDGLSILDFTVHQNQIFLVTPIGLLKYVWGKPVVSDVHLVMGKLIGTKPKESSTGEVVFEAGERLIVVPVEVVDLNNVHRFVLQYRLYKKGESGYWNTISTQTEKISFPHLDAGTYVVEVRLFDPYSGMQTAMNAQSFTIEKNWWENTWFHILVGAILGAVLMLGFRKIASNRN